MNQKISSSQIYILLFLSRIFTIITSSTAIPKASNGGVVLLSNFIGTTLIFIAVIPIILIINKNQQKDIIELSFSKNRFLGFFVGGFYSLFFFLVSLASLLSFSLFIADEVFINSSSILIIISLLVVVFYAIYNKIEAISRMSSIILVFFIATFLFVTLASAKNIDFNNLLPPNYNDYKNFLQQVSDSFYKNIEIIAILFLAKFSASNITKRIWVYILSILLVIETLIFFIISTLGSYLQTKSYPFYSLTTMAEVSVFKRLDSIHMGIWVAIGVIKVSLFLYLSITTFKSITKNKLNKNASIVLSASMLVLGFILGFSSQAVEYLEGIIYSREVFITAAVIIPFIGLLITNRRKVI